MLLKNGQYQLPRWTNRWVTGLARWPLGSGSVCSSNPTLGSSGTTTNILKSSLILFVLCRLIFLSKLKNMLCLRSPYFLIVQHSSFALLASEGQRLGGIWKTRNDKSKRIAWFWKRKIWLSSFFWDEIQKQPIPRIGPCLNHCQFQQALECVRHSLYHCPNSMRDIPLLSLANIMHRAG